MKRVVSVIVVLLMCAALAIPAFAAGSFVPSISYKDGAEIVKAEQNGENVTNCVVVTSLKEAKEQTTDILQEDRDLLWEVYEKLSSNAMELPLENERYVVRELVDVSFTKTGCVEVPHGHKQWLAEENTTIEIIFDLGIKENVKLEVLVFLDGKWSAVNSAVNNGDGTVTCVLEDLCPVAFCVEPQSELDPPKTGDAIGQGLVRWTVILVISAAAVVVLMINRRKFIR